MPRALSGLEQEVRRSGGSVRQTTTYNPTTGKSKDLRLTNTSEVKTIYLEIENVGASLAGGFTNTNELKVMKFQETVDGSDGESWKKATVNEHNKM